MTHVKDHPDWEALCDRAGTCDADTAIAVAYVATIAEWRAEMNQLRDRIRHMNQNATEREAALQNAVSDLRRAIESREGAFAEHDPEGHCAACVSEIIYKLPRSEP